MPQEPRLDLQQMQRMIDERRFARHERTRSNTYSDGHFLANDQMYFTPLTKPLAESTVALISSIGFQLNSDKPYDILDRVGVSRIREIHGDVLSADLMATHGQVDTRAANMDINCAFPIDRLREFADEGRFGRVAPTY